MSFFTLLFVLLIVLISFVNTACLKMLVIISLNLFFVVHCGNHLFQLVVLLLVKLDDVRVYVLIHSLPFLIMSFPMGSRSQK